MELMSWSHNRAAARGRCVGLELRLSRFRTSTLCQEPAMNTRLCCAALRVGRVAIRLGLGTAVRARTRTVTTSISAAGVGIAVEASVLTMKTRLAGGESAGARDIDLITLAAIA